MGLADDLLALGVGGLGQAPLVDQEGGLLLGAGDDTRAGADDYAAQILETLEAEVRKALAGIEKGIDVLASRQAELNPVEVAPADGEEKPLEDWPDADDDGPAYLREEDAGQTVPR